VIDKYEEYLAEARKTHSTKMGKRRRAQDIILDGVAVAIGYWTEQNHFDMAVMTQEELKEFSVLLKQQADRVAKLFGYDEAWIA
jgi:hypothetical protein